jgi:hypothetical protein
MTPSGVYHQLVNVRTPSAGAAAEKSIRIDVHSA